MRAIGDLDHVIALVRDLDAAAERARLLGFVPTPPALHSAAMGTANATIVFPDGTYVEMLTVREKTPLSAAFATRLEKREGPFGVAFKTDDAKAAARAFEGAGVADGGPIEFARPVELEDGEREAAFTIARLRSDATPGAPMFVCQHHTPDVVWRTGYLEHPNGVIGLAEVIGVASDVLSLRAAYQTLLPGCIDDEPDGLTIRTGTATIRFLTPLAYAARFGRMVRSGEAHLVSVVFKTTDLERCNALLKSNGITVAASGRGSLLVPREDAAGTMIEFVPATA